MHTKPPLKLPLHCNVKLLGWASFLKDIASEMIFPLLPQFLMSMLGGNRFYLGVIEGVADSVASLLKLWSGARSDRALLVRAGELGVATAHLPLLWFGFHVVKSVGNVGLGRLVDVVGPRVVFALRHPDRSIGDGSWNTVDVGQDSPNIFASPSSRWQRPWLASSSQRSAVIREFRSKNSKLTSIVWLDAKAVSVFGESFTGADTPSPDDVFG